VVALALHCDGADGLLDTGEIVTRQLDVGRVQIFLQRVQLGGAGDRQRMLVAPRSTLSIKRKELAAARSRS
jgi:hypothetical protein